MSLDITVIPANLLAGSLGKKLWKEAIALNNIIYLWDVFESSDLRNIVNEFGAPKLLINDSLHFNYSITDLPIFYYPGWLECEIERLKTTAMASDLSSSYCFNFCINKKQINRYLLIKLVEHFNLTNFDYTWSGLGRSFDMSVIIDEISTMYFPLELKIKLLAPIDLAAKFIASPVNLPLKDTDTIWNVEDYGGNVWTWNNGLRDIFSKSVVSLISESVTYDKTIHFSEKTAYAIMGGTFPIWVGGYNQALEWEKLGFDTFSDIINHDYQYKNTLVERCYFAIHDNLKILSDFDYASNLRNMCRSRLVQNQQLLMSELLKKYNNSLVNQLPVEYQTSIFKIIEISRNNKLELCSHY